MLRMYIVYLLMLIFGIAIISRAVVIQSTYKKEYNDIPDSSNVRYQAIKSSRGSIYSADEKLLATSVPVFEIRMDIASPNIDDDLFYKKLDSLSKGFSGLFHDKSPSSYKELLISERTKGNRYLLIKRNVTYDQLVALRRFPILRRGRYKGGFIIEPKEIRVNPYRWLAYRTLGWDKEGENLDVGLEGAYSDVLSGKDGLKLYQRLPNGSWRPVSETNLLDPENGKDLISTIDLYIQDITENALHEQLKKSLAHHGCAVVMEVETGAVKAIANLKIDSSDMQYKERYNYAVGESFEPGSTFKLASVMVGLEHGLINLNDSVDINQGYFRYGSVEMRDATVSSYGKISGRKAFEISSNVGISKIITNAYLSNPRKFTDQLRKMRLHQPLGLSIKGEGIPVIKSPDSRSWSGTSLPWMAIGYELRMTPLQILSFYNAVANNGVMVKPQFVKEIKQYGKTVKTFDPVILHKSIANTRTIMQARSLLEGVVERGTATKIKSEAYKIAGKTGTSKIAKPSGGYYDTKYYASFVGYFPADNPKYSCIVVVNKPQGAYYGGDVAGPVFKSIADKVYALYLNAQHETAMQFNGYTFPKPAPGIKKSRKFLLDAFRINVTDSAQTKWVRCFSGNDYIIFKNYDITKQKIPDMSGMTATDAVWILERAGIKVKIKGRGRVDKQSITPGTAIQPGMTIWLSLKTS
ncbi:MAG: penicillin-binding protein [Bacteroidales bacterium]|nr:penicillin-binding protein [Bacteroidales bacterium]